MHSGDEISIRLETLVHRDENLQESEILLAGHWSQYNLKKIGQKYNFFKVLYVPLLD